jgi:hypothetical protein
MFATSAKEVVPGTKQNISAKKTIVTIFFTSTRLLVLNFLPKGTKFNQDYFIDTVLPNLYSEKRRITRRKGLPSFSVHMDNSMCQRSLENWTRDTLHELLTHFIHQTSARVTFGYLWSWSRSWRSTFFRVKNKFWPRSPRAGMSSHSRTSREFSIVGMPNMGDCQQRRILLIINSWITINFTGSRNNPGAQAFFTVYIKCQGRGGTSAKWPGG